MIEIRVEIRTAEGGYIVSAFNHEGRTAIREEIFVAKADAISAATRLHAESLTRCEEWRKRAAQERGLYQNQPAPREAARGQRTGEGMINTAAMNLAQMERSR